MATSKVSTERALKFRARWTECLNNIFRSAHIQGRTHESMLSSYAEQVTDTPEWARVPAYVQEYVRGYRDCLRNEVYRTHLVWMLSVDGALLTSREVDTLTAQEKLAGADKEPNYRSPWSRVDGNLSRHVWRDDAGMPRLDCPFDARFIGR